MPLLGSQTPKCGALPCHSTAQPMLSQDLPFPSHWFRSPRHFFSPSPPSIAAPLTALSLPCSPCGYVRRVALSCRQ